MASERRQREKELGKRTRTRSRADAKTCGAGTTKCKHCKCHRRTHPKVDNRRVSCVECGPEKCPGFVPKPCGQRHPFLYRNNRCELHGGKSSVGISSPSFASGIYSKVVPRRLAEHYERLLGDDELLSLKHEIALTRVYIRDNVERSGRDEWVGPLAVKAFAKLKRAWDRFSTVSTENAKMKASLDGDAAIADLAKAMSASTIEAEARAEFRELTLSLERLETSENRRVVQLYNMISAERAFALRHAETSALLEALDEHVADREIRNAVRRSVASKLAKLVAGRNLAAMGTGGGPPVVGDPIPVVDPEAED